ncbi:MAG TPA: cAMP-binding protein, partial [Pseudomonas sp.]|nr:cAMP-binding protein [Pseudomonas sp.]
MIYSLARPGLLCADVTLPIVCPFRSRITDMYLLGEQPAYADRLIT